MSWENDATGYLAELSRSPGARQPATIGEVWDSEWKRTALDTIAGVGQPYGDARADLVTAIEGASGKSIEDYAAEKGIRLGSGVMQADDIRLLGSLADTLPEERRRAIEPLKDIRLNAARKAQKIELEADDVGNATYGLSAHATAFMAGVARQAADPVNVAAMVATAPLGAARGASLLATVGREAGANAAAQLVVEPVIEPQRDRLGLDSGFGRGAGNVLEAGIGGGVLSGMFHLAGRGVRSLRGSPDRVAPEGTIATPPPETRARESGIAPEARPDPAPTGPMAAASPAEQFAPDDFHAAGDLAARDHVIDAMSPVDTAEGRIDHAVKVDEAAAQIDAVTGFQAFHGSPHDFNAFDVTRIGTGEGAQSYGHGLYFAENEGIARHYQKTTSEADFIRKAQELYQEFDKPDDAAAAVRDSKEFTAGQKRLLAALEKDDWLGFDYPHQAVSAALGRNAEANFDLSPETIAAIKSVGNMYGVRINADRSHFLDWDRSFDGQTRYVQDALRKMGFNEHEIAGMPGGSLIESMGARNSPETSKALAEAGIVGIKYLDRGARGGGEHTQNFVLFNDRHVEIAHKNNEPVRLADVPFPEQYKVKVAPDPDPATVKTVHVKPKTARGRAAADPATFSLNEHLASVGGLRPDPELFAIYGNKRGPFVPGFGQLIRKGGKTLDDALRSAKEAGYLGDPHDAANGTAGGSGRVGLGLIPRDLLDVLDAENRGTKLYKAGHLAEAKIDDAAEGHAILGALDKELHASTGADIAVDPVIGARVVEIVRKEGETDVLAAYERAIMEDAERYEGLAAARQADAELAKIPGWDPDEPGAAPRDGAADPGQRRQAAGAGQKDIGSDGHAARSPGDGAGTPRQLGDLALAADAARAIEEAGGDLEITLLNPDGTTRTLKASDALREVEEDARAADELNACIAGAAEEVPF